MIENEEKFKKEILDVLIKNGIDGCYFFLKDGERYLSACTGLDGGDLSYLYFKLQVHLSGKCAGIDLNTEEL